jgi:hypothetical protein
MTTYQETRVDEQCGLLLLRCTPVYVELSPLFSTSLSVSREAKVWLGEIDTLQSSQTAGLLGWDFSNFLSLVTRGISLQSKHEADE